MVVKIRGVGVWWDEDGERRLGSVAEIFVQWSGGANLVWAWRFNVLSRGTV